MLRMWNNPNRFLRSIKPWVHNNPQPNKVWRRRMAARFWNSTSRKERKVRPIKFFIPKSSGLLR